ncbi:Ig-like domain-containing protein [Paenibacillus sp. YIM B09110]|uniref:Ig-like domain-containing protein n=1 Tax=Paenibacillus sp. YIM B09110 TaxID=3126102 RepID=UPI00301DE03D
MRFIRTPLSLLTILLIAAQLFLLPMGVSASAEGSRNYLSEAPSSASNQNVLEPFEHNPPSYAMNSGRVEGSAAGNAPGHSTSSVNSDGSISVIVPVHLENSYSIDEIKVYLVTKRVYGEAENDYLYSRRYLYDYEENISNYDYTVNYDEDIVTLHFNTNEWSNGTEQYLLMAVGSYAIKLPISIETSSPIQLDLSSYVPVTIDLPNEGQYFEYDQNIVTFLDNNQRAIGGAPIQASGKILVKPDTYNMQINAYDLDKAYSLFKKDVVVSGTTTLLFGQEELTKISFQVDDEEWEATDIGLVPMEGAFSPIERASLYSGSKLGLVDHIYVSKLSYSEIVYGFESNQEYVYVDFSQKFKEVSNDFIFRTDMNLESKISLNRDVYRVGEIINPDVVGIIDGFGNRVSYLSEWGDWDNKHKITYTNNETNQVIERDYTYLNYGTTLPVNPGVYTMTFTPGAGAEYLKLKPASAQINITNSGQEIRLIGLYLNKTTVNITGLAKTETVMAQALYNDATMPDVTQIAEWESSNEAVATVSNGVITSTGVGSAIISASLGGQSQSVKVNVASEQLVTNLSASMSKLNGRVGVEYPVTLTAAYADKKTSDVTTMANWTSTKYQVAEVIDGKVKVNGYGTATLTGSYGGKKVAISVNSQAKNVYIGTSAIEKVKTLILQPIYEQSIQLVMKAQFADSAGNKPEVIDSGVNWSSTNPMIASVSETGVLRVNWYGTARITGEYNGLVYSIDVDSSAKSVSVSDSTGRAVKSINMHPNQVKNDWKHIATFKDNTRSEFYNDEVEWATDNPNVATVDSVGNVTAVGYGRANITVAYAGKSIKFQVNVALSSIKANLKKIAGKGEHHIELIATYGDKYTEDVTNQATWTSSTSIASVENGVVTVNGFGKGKITATFGDPASRNVKSISIPIDVSVKSLTSLTKKITGAPGQEYDIELIATLSDGKLDSTEDVAAGTVWATSNANVATVVDGVISVVGIGKANITAVYGGKRITIAVDVPFKLTVDASKQSIVAGNSVPYVVTATYSDKSTQDVSGLATVSVSGRDIISVDNGNINALKAGSSTVTLRYGGKTVVIAVKVTPNIAP